MPGEPAGIVALGDMPAIVAAGEAAAMLESGDVAAMLEPGDIGAVLAPAEVAAALGAPEARWLAAGVLPADWLQAPSARTATAPSAAERIEIMNILVDKLMRPVRAPCTCVRGAPSGRWLCSVFARTWAGRPAAVRLRA